MTAPLSAQTAVEGRYLLDAALEGWGLGEAWLCRDKNFRNRPVVLKFLPLERSDRLSELAQELRAQRALKHPHVLPVINQGMHQGRAWVAYDGWDGVPLLRMLDEHRRTRGMLEAATVRALFGKVLEAIAAGHEAAVPVLHGCLQPTSVIVKADAVKVVDFGLFAFYPAAALAPFVAPELTVDGAVPSIASDIYALGATLAEMLLPSQGAGDPRRALEAFLRALGREGSQVGRGQRNDVALALWDVIARATRLEPSARWDDAHAFRAALDAAWEAVPVAPARASTEVPLAPDPAPSAASRLVPLGPAFSTALPPLDAAPVAPMAPPAPAAAFLRSPPVAGMPAFQPPPVQAYGSVGDPFSPLPSSSATASAHAWTAARSALREERPVDASAWDPPDASNHPGTPWAASGGAPRAPGTPTVPAPITPEDEWEEKTRAAEPRPFVESLAANSKAVQESTMALDVDALGGLPPPSTEATRALDVDALARGAQRASALHVVSSPRDGSSDDAWKDSVVLLDTSSGNAEPPGAYGDEEDVYEPGARTRMVPPPAEVLETMATLQPKRGPTMSPVAPPVAPASERTMALDTDVASASFATVPAPMAHVQAMALAPPRAPFSPSNPRGGLDAPPPASPPRGRAPLGRSPEASRGPIVAAVVVSFLLVGGAIAFVLLR